MFKTFFKFTRLIAFLSAGAFLTAPVDDARAREGAQSSPTRGAMQSRILNTIHPIIAGKHRHHGHRRHTSLCRPWGPLLCPLPKPKGMERRQESLAPGHVEPISSAI